MKELFLAIFAFISFIFVEKMIKKLGLQHARKLLPFLLLFYSCSAPEKPEEYLFLENVMIRERGLYVLLGSKPMSTFSIDNGFPETEEERKQYYETYMRGIKKDAPNRPLQKYEDFSESCKKLIHQHDRRLWNTWENQINSHVLPQYKFVARKSPFDNQRKGGLFLNIPNTLYVLKAHYDSFSRITGIRFDPDTILEELSNDDSLFWERAFQSHYLGGLLFGYGEKNAICFDWKMRTNISLPSMQIADQPNLDQVVEISTKKKVKLSDLKLPLFGVYSIDDPTIEQYKKEREYIIKKLKGGDLPKKIMELLVENS